MTGEYGALLCPMPDGNGGRCAEPLGYKWTLYTSAGMTDFDGGSVPVPSDAEVGEWQVECVVGHVLLTPAGLTACEHPDGEGCQGHDEDTSEELRTIRPSDMRRLRSVLAELGPVVDLDGVKAVVSGSAAETHDDETIDRVHRAIAAAVPGITINGINDAINGMQNAGILFRERATGGVVGPIGKVGDQ